MTPQGAARLYKDLYITAWVKPRQDVITSETFSIALPVLKGRTNMGTVVLKKHA